MCGHSVYRERLFQAHSPVQLQGTNRSILFSRSWLQLGQVPCSKLSGMRLRRIHLANIQTWPKYFPELSCPFPFPGLLIRRSGCQQKPAPFKQLLPCTQHIWWHHAPVRSRHRSWTELSLSESSRSTELLSVENTSIHIPTMQWGQDCFRGIC